MIGLGVRQRLRQCLRSQRGGIALLMVIGFMALGVPLVTSALGLAATTSIDSRSKKQILRRQYCALGTGEYVNYLLNSTARWAQWWVDHPSGQETTLDFCGESVTLSITLPPQPPIDSLSASPSSQGQVPPISAYNNRRLQTAESPFELSKNLNCPMMFHFGEIDLNPSLDDMARFDEEMTRLGKPHEFYVYPGADHRFLDHTFTAYQREASELSWARTLDFFAVNLNA